MRLLTKDEMLGMLKHIREGAERGTYVLRPNLAEADPEYNEKLKEVMLSTLDRMIKTTEFLFDNHA